MSVRGMAVMTSAEGTSPYTFTMGSSASADRINAIASFNRSRAAAALRPTYRPL
ncbi:MAG: hypothetical protein JNM69_04935 [Archangium sp.]|nr:hypothetical protein [Archangium sp.]